MRKIFGRLGVAILRAPNVPGTVGRRELATLFSASVSLSLSWSSSVENCFDTLALLPRYAVLQLPVEL